MTYTVLCSVARSRHNGFVGCYKVEASSEKEAAIQSCERYGWVQVKVRGSADDVPKYTLADWRVYAWYGKLIRETRQKYCGPVS